MSYYSAIILITILALVSFIVAVLCDSTLKKTTKYSFVFCMAASIFGALCEFVVQCLDGVPNRNTGIIVAAKVLELTISPMIPLFLYATIFDYSKLKAVVPFCLMNGIFQVASIFNGMIFYFDENNLLQKGDFHWIFIGFYTTSILIMFVGCIISSKRYQNRNLLLLTAILIFTLTGVSSHLANYNNLKIDWLVTTLSLFLLFYYYRSLYMQVDELTDLLDRRTYTIYKDKIKKNAVVIIMDVDDFKNVNDTHGHVVGDQCLALIGDVFKKVYQKYGHCFRVGGDEFCIVLTRAMERIDEFNSKFNETLMERSKKEIGFPLSVSVGFGDFRPGENQMVDAINEADMMMYRNKNSKHNQKSLEKLEITQKKAESIVKKRHKILVIEDNEINREILDSILSPQYEILQAENGKEGLELLDETKDISLILLDIQMPVMNGYEFLDAFGKITDYSSIPIIVTTASSTATDEIKCLENGAIDFISKPYNPQVVLRRVDSILRFKEAAQIISKVEHDRATGFYNKDFFYMNVEKLLSDNPDTEFDMLCLCVYSFRANFESVGVRNRNDIMARLADTIRSCYPDGLIYGKIRNNVFALICKHSDREYYEYGAKTIRNIIKESSVPNVVTNIGLYNNVDKRLSASAIFENALLPIDRNKYQYEGQIAEYDEEIKEKLLRQQIMSDLMEESIEKKYFAVYYQAKHQYSTDRTGGAEALIRWIHPELGFVSPGDFVPLFESNGFITRLDYYVLEQVCRDMREWMIKGIPVVPISINLSRVDFEDVDLVSKLNRMVNKYSIPKELIHFEVTESAYIDNLDRVLDDISKIHRMGFCIELDDFGTGYSSLSMLNKMDIDVLKLDMSLVRNLESDNQTALLKYIFAIANNFGMKTVAEGVETKQQTDILRDMGCTYAQGYYYSKPIPKEEFSEYLSQN